MQIFPVVTDNACSIFAMLIKIFVFTVVTRRPGETGHVAVAGVTVPLLHARAVVRAQVVCALFPGMKARVHVAAGFH